jgi:hypothetical protein
MADMRMTTKAQLAPETPARARTAVRGAVKPVAGRGGVDADGQRAQDEPHAERDESEAGAGHVAADAAEALDAVAAEAGAQAVVEEFHRLGSEALHVLQPIGEQARRLAEGHVDDEA